MRSNYKKLGSYIHPVDERNSDLAITNLQGVSITKEFVPSIANIIGTDLSTYKIVRTGQFAYGPVTSRNGDKVSIALLKGKDCIISSSYSPFEVYRPDELLPEYLMLWFMRPEFDRYARFMSNGSAREVFDWDCMCGVEIPVPPPLEQKKIVRNYQVITDRIALLRKINENLEAQAIAICTNFFPLSEEVDENGYIADICSKIYSGGTPATSEDAYWDGDLPWLSSGETSNSYVTKTEKHISEDGVRNSSTKLAKAGCTVIASAGQGKTRGQTSLLFIDTYVNQSVVVLQPKKGFEYILFSNLKDRYEEMRQLSDLDSIRGSLTTKSIGSLPFRNSGHTEINGYLKAIFDVIRNNSFELDKLGRLQTLASEGAFTGA